MNYPDDNYDNVHEAIIDELRVEYEQWVAIEQRETEQDKKDIARTVQRRLTNRANKIRICQPHHKQTTLKNETQSSQEPTKPDATL